MSNLKRICALIISVAMILSLFAGLSINSYASDIIASGTCHMNGREGNPDDYIYWELDSEGTLNISGHGTMVQKEYAWTAFWEDYDELVKKVVVGEGVKNLSSGAFSHCINLTDVQLPSTLETIESRAFIACNSLVSITIPENVTYIADEIFGWCENLEEVVFLSDKITFMDSSVFSQCFKLKSIVLPKEADGLNAYMFQDTAYYADKNNWTDGSLIMDDWLLAVSPDVKGHYDIPAGVNHIAKNAFSECTEITSVIIPENITQITDWMFSGCTGLEEINIPDSVTSIGEYAFNECTSLKNVDLPAGLLEIGEGAFYGCTSLEEIWFPDSLINIGNRAFGSCSSLTEIIIPESVTMLEDGVFSECTSLQSIAVLNPDCDTGLGYSTLDDIYNNSNGFFMIPVNCMGTIPEQATAYCYEGSPVHVYSLIVKRNYSFDIGQFEKKQAEHWDTKANEITVIFNDENSRVEITEKATAEGIINLFEDKEICIFNSNGTPVAIDSYVGTGSVLQISDSQGEKIAEYTVLVKSDVDGNGKITAADARLALRTSASLDNLEGVYAEAANIDGNDKVTAADARMILRKSAGLE